ncbi:MAG: hypothetical protein NXI14_08925 [bacterium]|nr:hypothetical protein [bacterium]
MAASTKKRPSILDRLTGRNQKNEQANPSAISAQLALRRSKMQNAARFKLWELAVSIALGPGDSTVSVDDTAAIMAEAGVNQAELDRMVEMIKTRSKRDTYRSISDQSMQAFRESRRLEHAHKESKKLAIAQFDDLIKKAAQDATRNHSEFRRYRELADEASLPIPLIEQILDAVREENRRQRNTVASIEDQLGAAKKLVEGTTTTVPDLIAEFIQHISKTNHGEQLERRNEMIATVFEDLGATRLADCSRDKIDRWATDEWNESRIERAQKEARIFLSWCFEQGYTDVDLGKGDRPSGVDHAKRIKALQAQLEEAQADLAASDDLVSEVEAESAKPVPFQSLE